MLQVSKQQGAETMWKKMQLYVEVKMQVKISIMGVKK